MLYNALNLGKSSPVLSEHDSAGRFLATIIMIAELVSNSFLVQNDVFFVKVFIIMLCHILL